MQFQRNKALAGEQQQEASPAADHEARACIHARDMLQVHETTTKLEPTSPAEEASWFFCSHCFPTLHTARSSPKCPRSWPRPSTCRRTPEVDSCGLRARGGLQLIYLASTLAAERSGTALGVWVPGAL